MKYPNTLLHEVLHCPMDPKTNDAKASTVGEYLGALLMTLWEEDEGFSGKRPFGNSGWQWDVYTALVKAGLAEGSVYDDDGFEELEGFSREAEALADEMIMQAIKLAYDHSG